jgi:hypothetical protein
MKLATARKGRLCERKCLFQNLMLNQKCIYSMGTSSMQIKDKTGQYVFKQGPIVYTFRLRPEFNEHIVQEIKDYVSDYLQWSSILWELKHETIDTRAALYELLNATSDVTEFTCEIHETDATFDLLVWVKQS